MAPVFPPDNPEIFKIRTHAAGPQGALPLTAEMLGGAPSGDLFGLTQNVGMGWEAATAAGPQFLVLSTQGG
ncbi:MAG: YjhG/YagF family D-xylonate dehydratase, partial [Chthoniobacteraceae bacterium]